MQTLNLSDCDGRRGITLAAYVPFGDDEQLSYYPEGESQQLMSHPIVCNLMKLVDLGVNVMAMIDRVGDETQLLEAIAGQAGNYRLTPIGKQQMQSPLTLAHFLRRAQQLQPQAALVLSIQGHGAGFLPQIDRRQMTVSRITNQGRLAWNINGDDSPALPAVSPMLPAVSPMLPAVSPMLPGGEMPMSTWELGEALRLAGQSGVARLAVLHLNNCFNMSVELLHTVSPYARYATGYINYNFFTAADAYPWVFEQLRAAGGTASAGQLAAWFAKGNERVLAAKGHHPTVGASVDLSRMQDIAEKVDDLSDALLSALRSATPTERPNVVLRIAKAIADAQQLDTGGNFQLEVPDDQLTDLRTLAIRLQEHTFGAAPVVPAARALERALQGIFQYGAKDSPWVDTSLRWDFSRGDMAMNIYLPDPARRGIFDWRAPFYMNVNPDPNAAPVQPHVIEFLKITDWVDFLHEYHRDVKFVGFKAAKLPVFPAFNAKFGQTPVKPDTTASTGPTGGIKPPKETPKEPPKR